MKKILHSTLALQALFCIVIACQGQTPTLYSVTVSNDYPLLYWNFDAGSGNAVQQMPVVPKPATTENDLVPVNGATRVSHASLGDGLRLNNAAEFAGNNQFVVSSASLGRATLANAVAIEMWARSTAANPQTYLMNFGGNTAALIYNYNPNYLELFAGAGGRTLDRGPVIADNDWHHIVFVYYGDGVEGVANRTDAYFDGALIQDIGAGMYCHPRLNSTIIVGSAQADGVGGFKGNIDEVAFYDLGALADEAAVTAKVSAMVTNHIASAKAATGPSYASLVLADQPLLYWNFDETNGNAVQQAPVVMPLLDNTKNDLVPQFNATWISHATAGSGLQLGYAADVDGQSYFGELSGLEAGRASIPGPWAVELWLQLRQPQAARYLLNMGPASANYNKPAIIYGYNGPTLEVFGNGRSGINGVPIADQNWHHLLVVNYNTAPGSTNPGTNVNRVDFYLDDVLYPNVGGGFNTPVLFGGWLLFGAATDNASGGFDGRLDELAIYDLSAYTNAADLSAKAAAMAGSHYAAAYGSSSGVVTITQPPTNTTGQLGQTVTFTVSARVSGTTSPLAYQWQRNGIGLNGATNSSYTTPALSLYDIGTNIYRVRVSAGAVFKFSDPATLVVAMPPTPPATFYSQRVLHDRPLLYWNFDEMTGPAWQQTELTPFPVTTQNDLVPFGNVQWANHSDLSDGLSKLGKALQLDGYSYLFAPSLWLGRPALNGPWAAEFWMQFQGQNGVAVNEYIANFGVGGGNVPALIYGYNIDRLELYNNTGGRSTTNGPTVDDNNWHHVLWVNYNTATGSYSPGTNVNRVDVYIDGTVKTNAGGGFNQVVSLTSLIFGAATTTPAGGFTGALDEFAIYDLGELNTAQIQTKAQNMATNHYAVAHSATGPSYSATVLADTPLLYWNFDVADTNAVQQAPVTLPAINNANNSLVPSGAGRVQHSGLHDSLYLGNAADFSGVDYYRVAQFNVGRPTALPAPWALEFWMQSQGPNANAYLVNFGGNSPAAIYNFLATYPQTLELYGPGGRTGFGGPVITDPAWHHVFWVLYGDGTAGVADGADVYLDGTLIPGVRANFSQPIDILNSLIVGQAIPGYNGWLGRLDELAIYDLSSFGTQDAIAAKVGQMVTNHLTAASSVPVVPPTMTFGVAGGKLTLTWSGSGFVLQQNNNLGNSTGWTNAPNGNVSPVTITIPATGDMFYRLKQ